MTIIIKKYQLITQTIIYFKKEIKNQFIKIIITKKLMKTKI